MILTECRKPLGYLNAVFETHSADTVENFSEV